MRKKLRAHKVDKYMENDRTSIKVDTHILTDIKIQFNKPDIIVHDKVQNEIVIVVNTLYICTPMSSNNKVLYSSSLLGASGADKIIIV